MILVDYGYISAKTIFASKKDIIQDINYAPHKIISNILSYAKQFGASIHNPMVIAMDSKPSWRHEFYTENCKDFPEYKDQTYKGNRTKDDTIPWDAIYSIMDDIMDCIKHHSDFLVVKEPMTEADDIIAVLSKECLKNKEKCFIISADKDFWQLQTHPYVQIYCPLKGIIIPEMNTEEYKTLHIMVAGDDNIKNIGKGMGIKTAIKTLPILQEHLALNPEMKKRFEFNQTLIDFNFIPPHIQDNIIENWNKQNHSFDQMKLMKKFSQYKLPVLIENSQHFKLRNAKIETTWNTKIDSVLQNQIINEVFDIDAFFA